MLIFVAFVTALFIPVGSIDVLFWAFALTEITQVS
jgi:hypothetical protein